MTVDTAATAKKTFNAEVASVRLSLVIELEREMRSASNVEALRFTIVNRVRELVPYHQAILLQHQTGKRYGVAAISNIAVIQRDAPYVAWAKAVASEIHRSGKATEMHSVPMIDWPEHLRDQARELSASCLLWCPLLDSSGHLLGGLLLARSNVWRDNESVLLNPVLECMAHAWAVFLRKRKLPKLFSHKRIWFLSILACLIGVMFLPVPQSSLAPSEVVAYQPDVVAAPLEGVIKEIHVEPNDPLTPGQILFEYDDALFRNAYDVAVREVELARVELEKVTQDAFTDASSKAEKAVMTARLAKKQDDLAFAGQQYQRIKVTANKAGIAIFNSPDDWIGRPVSTGQRIMLIADPEQVAIDAMLPIKDSIEMRPGSKVQLFLDNSPLQPLQGSVLRTSYDAEQTPEGFMAFRVRILLDADERLPRIGARGVSKIYGDSVSLFFFLFRRPLTVLRQTLGF